jgi:adenylate kinase
MQMGKGMKIIIVGSEGSGKTTQTRLLAEEFVLHPVCVGDLVRAEIRKDTSLGQICREVRERGDYLPDAEIGQLVLPYLGQLDISSGFVMEGYPRTLIQAQTLKMFLREHNTCLDKAVFLTLTEEEAIARLVKRGRADDTPSKIRGRLQAFNRDVNKMRAFYLSEGILVEVNGGLPIDGVYVSIKKALGV